MAYTAEIIIKWRETGIRQFFCDVDTMKWNITDFTLTVMSVMDVAGRSFLPGSAQHILQPMSVLRLARLIRVIHLLKNVPSLTVTIGGVFGSLAPLLWIVMALLS